MSVLRSATVRRIVLACFLWAVGVAGVSPVFATGPVLDAVCSADGSVRWAPFPAPSPAGDAPDTPGVPHAHGLDCPACLPTSLPPPSAQAAHPLQPAPARCGPPLGRQDFHPRPAAAAPLPARGPPQRA